MKPLKFALATPALINYPAAMAPWEPAAGGPEILRYAKAADKQKWDWLTIPEHIFMPGMMEETMGARFPEGLSAAAVLLGATERIKTLTYILVLPLRNPLMLAKQISTVDFLTGGRFTLGTAVGHMEPEFDVMGVSFKERGKIADESLEVMKECWTSDRPTFDGPYTKFDDIAFEPKPVQKPHPQIFIGGNSKPAMRRAAKYGNGWIPWLITAAELPASIEYLRSQPGFAEKEDTFEIIMPTTAYQIEDYSHAETGETKIEGDRDAVLRDIETLQKAGMTGAQVMPPQLETFEQCLEWIAWFDSEIIPNFQ